MLPFKLHIKTYIWAVMVALLMPACKTAGVKKSRKMKELAHIVELHEQYKPSFRYLEGRAKVHFDDGRNALNFTLKYRIEHHNKIWLQANMMGIPLAKMEITPGSVRYYDKIKGNCFDGDFDLIKRKTGVELDYQSVENLLLGMAVFPLDAGKARIETGENGYRIATPPVAGMEADYFIAPPHYRVAEEVLRTADGRLKVSYPEYRKTDEQYFPGRIMLSGRTEHDNIDIELKVTRLSLPGKLHFPFHFPEGCR